MSKFLIIAGYITAGLAALSFIRELSISYFNWRDHKNFLQNTKNRNV